jgi:nicotinic acid mononucleotide adenylyltransferase
MKNISSTQIRDMIKNNAADIEKLVPKEVLKYIKENNLYGK